MAILTARQPVVQAPDVVELGKFAANMIQSELAARTQIGQFVAQQQQNDLKLQAQGRQEIRETYNDRYTRERQARVDDLNEKLQLSQDRRAEERLKMDQRLEPLDYAAKQLALRSGAFNLDQARTLAPYKVAAAEADIAASAINQQQDQAKLDAANAQLPVIEGQADLALQQQNLAKVARGSLSNVKTATDMEGWADAHLANLPGDPDQQSAEAMARLNALGLDAQERTKAEQAITKRVEENKALNSNRSSLFPEDSASMANQFVRSGSSFITLPNGKTRYASEIPLPELNRAAQANGLPAMAPDEYAKLPKPAVTSAEITAQSRTLNNQIDVIQSEADKLMVLAKEALQNGDAPAAKAYMESAEAKYKEAQAVTPTGATPPNLTIDPTKPAAPTGVAAPINPRRAAVLGLLPQK